MTLVGMTGYVTFEKNGLEFRRIAQLTVNFTAAKSDWASPTTKLVDGKIQADTLLEGQSDERVLLLATALWASTFLDYRNFMDKTLYPFTPLISLPATTANRFRNMT